MKIFLDVDGVFADFDKKLNEVCGEDIPRFSDEIWGPLSQVDNLFYTLEVLPNSLKIIEAVKGHDVEFLTALPHLTGKLSTADADKRKWLREHISSTIPINTCIGGKNKPKWLKANPGALLIDDYGRNIRMWEAAGGLTIKHESVDSTLAQLIAMGVTRV